MDPAPQMNPAQHMNCVQKLMISGSPERGCLEQTADGCLSLPSSMWQEKNVKWIESQDGMRPHYVVNSLGQCLCESIDYGFCSGNFNGNFFGEATTGVFKITFCGLPSLAGYVVMSIVSAPLLAIGACFKGMAFCSDEKAYDYNESIAIHLKNDNQVNENIESLESHLNNDKEQLEIIQKKLEVNNHIKP